MVAVALQGHFEIQAASVPGFYKLPNIPAALAASQLQ
jgi:hypothetical protein